MIETARATRALSANDEPPNFATDLMEFKVCTLRLRRLRELFLRSDTSLLHVHYNIIVVALLPV